MRQLVMQRPSSSASCAYLSDLRVCSRLARPATSRRLKNLPLFQRCRGFGARQEAQTNGRIDGFTLIGARGFCRSGRAAVWQWAAVQQRLAAHPPCFCTQCLMLATLKAHSVQNRAVGGITFCHSICQRLPTSNLQPFTAAPLSTDAAALGRLSPLPRAPQAQQLVARRSRVICKHAAGRLAGGPGGAGHLLAGVALGRACHAVAAAASHHWDHAGEGGWGGVGVRGLGVGE